MTKKLYIYQNVGYPLVNHLGELNCLLYFENKEILFSGHLYLAVVLSVAPNEA